jgi:hypothetical protein
VPTKAGRAPVDRTAAEKREPGLGGGASSEREARERRAPAEATR